MKRCYACGAYPNNPDKRFDTLKLIKCLDCGNISCMRHRKGLIDTQCPICSSHRSTNIAFKQGSFGVPGGKAASGGRAPAPAGGSPSQSNSASQETAHTTISKKTLMEMQKIRKDVEDHIREQQKNAGLETSAEEDIKTKNFLKNFKVDDDIKKIHQKIQDKQNKNILGVTSESIENLSGALPAFTSLALSIKSAMLDEKDDSDNSHKGSGPMAAKSSSKNKNKTKSLKKSGTKSEEENIIISFVNESNQEMEINIRDYFHVINEKDFNISKFIEEKRETEEKVVDLLAKKLRKNARNITLTLKINLYISLESIDKYSLINKELLKDNNIDIVTGISGAKLNTDLLLFLEQFRLSIKHHSSISGLYYHFENSDSCDIEEQKQFVIELLDTAYENNLTVYLSNSEENIEFWEELFEEYDLSSIKFVYLSGIKDSTDFEFIKNNNIKLAITKDSDFHLIEENLPEYLNNLVIATMGKEKNLVNIINKIDKMPPEAKKQLINFGQND